MKTYFVLCGVLTAFAVQAATWTGGGALVSQGIGNSTVLIFR